MAELIVAVETFKKKSVGPILRCSSAFGATTVAVIGHSSYSTHGAHGAQNHLQVMHFYYWADFVEYVRSKGFKIYSISSSVIHSSDTTLKSSQSVDSFVFDGPTCFIIGEKEGLTPEQIEISDGVLHVDIPNATKEHLINYDAKIAICLQQYAIQNAYKARSFVEEKHVLGKKELIKCKTVKYSRHELKKTQTTSIEENMEFGDLDFNVSGLYGDVDTNNTV